MRMRSRHLAATGLLALTMGAAAAPAHGGRHRGLRCQRACGPMCEGSEPRRAVGHLPRRDAPDRRRRADVDALRFEEQRRATHAGGDQGARPGRLAQVPARGARVRAPAAGASSSRRAPPTASWCSYRWYDEDGRLIRRAKRRSAVCRQPGPLPNLRVRGVTATPIDAQTVRYAVQIVQPRERPGGRLRSPPVGGREHASTGGWSACWAPSACAGSTSRAPAAAPACGPMPILVTWSRGQRGRQHADPRLPVVSSLTLTARRIRRRYHG